MSKDTIKVNMNVYDIPILVEQLKKLEQENKQLKERYERLKQEHIDTITRNEEKQQRIDKAIEYLKDNACYENTISELFCDDLDTDSCMELLDILRGEDNEQ